MLQFMDHNQDRDMEGVEEQVSVLQFLLFFFYSRHHHKVVKRIREDWGQTQLSEDLLRRIDGILDVNSVEHRVMIQRHRYENTNTNTSIKTHRFENINTICILAFLVSTLSGIG